MLPPADKRLRNEPRTGLDCIKQEYQEHHTATAAHAAMAAADYTGDMAKRLATNPAQEMQPTAGAYGRRDDYLSGFGGQPVAQPPSSGYWQTQQGNTRGDSFPPADPWNNQQPQQQLPIKQEFGAGYPEPGFPQQDYNRPGFDNQSAQSSWAARGNLAYSEVGKWSQDYGQASQVQVQGGAVQIPPQPPQVSTSGAYAADPTMMSGTAAQWGFPPPFAPKVEPGVATSAVPYGISTSLPPPSLQLPTSQPLPGLPPATVPATGPPPFSQLGGPAQPPVGFPPLPAPSLMGQPPPRPPATGQQQLPDSGGYGGQRWNARSGGDHKPDLAERRPGAGGQPNIPSLLSEEQMSAIRMGSSERGTERDEDRGRSFDRNRDSSWRDRSAGDRRDRDRDGGGGRGDRGQWGDDRSRQGRDSGGGRFRDQSRGDRDRRDFSHGSRDVVRSGRDDRDRYDRGRSDRDRNFGRSRDRDGGSRDRDYDHDSRDRDRDRTGRDADREQDRGVRDGSHDSSRLQRHDDQPKRSSRWGPQEADIKPPVLSLDVPPAGDSSGILGPPPDPNKSRNVPEIKVEPGASSPSEVSLLGPPPGSLPPTSMTTGAPASALPPPRPPVPSVRPPFPPAIKPDPDAPARDQADDGILGEMPSTVPAAGDMTGGGGGAGGMEDLGGGGFRGPRPPSGPLPPPGRFSGPPLRGPPPPPPGRGGLPPFRGPPPFGGPPVPPQRGLRPPPPPGFGPGGMGGPPQGIPPGPMPPVRGGPPRWPPHGPRPFR